jgi:hypothetical protein
MSLQRMDNVLIVVDDLEAAKAFFVELGMELEGEMPIEGRWVDLVVGLENVQCEIAMMRTPDGHSRLELTKFHAPAAVKAEPKNEGVPPFTRGVIGHEIGLVLARELRPLVPGHPLPLSSPQRIQWHVCGGRRGQDGCDRADAV